MVATIPIVASTLGNILYHEFQTIVSTGIS